MEQNSIVMSYMIRCTLEPNGCLRVFTRQITSGEERHFASLEDTLGYIQEQMKAAQEETQDTNGQKRR